MGNNKIQEIITKINKKIPFDVSDLSIAIGFIAVLIATYAGNKLHKDYVELVNNDPQIIKEETSIEVGDDGMAHTVTVYTEAVDPITYTDEITGETCYAVPDGYGLTYNDNGEAICIRTYKETTQGTKETKTR